MDSDRLIDRLQDLMSGATAGQRGDIRRMIRSLELPSAFSGGAVERAEQLIDRIRRPRHDEWAAPYRSPDRSSRRYFR